MIPAFLEFSADAARAMMCAGWMLGIPAYGIYLAANEWHTSRHR